MNILKRKSVFIIIFSLVTFSLAGCSVVNKVTNSLNNKKSVNYHNNKTIQNLEVPPDLTTPEFDDAFALPTGTVSAVGLKNGVYQKSEYYRGPASIVNIAGKSVTRVNSPHSKALLSTPVMLEKMKFKVLTKSVSGEVITAKYTGDDIRFNKSVIPSFLEYIIIGGKRKRLLKFNGALEKNADYRISIKNENGQSVVSFARVDGRKISVKGHAKIAELLNSAFRN